MQSQVIIPARFPGGEKAYGKFLEKNLKWPGTSIDAQGRIIITFTVEKNGRLTNIRVSKGLGEPFDREALRVIKKSPDWIPATKNGKPMRSTQSVPINFTLSD
jgi:protein TonB